MSWKNIRLIFLREVRDQLRDRRTLFMVAVLPLLLYPALGMGIVQMTVTFSEQMRTVVVLGADDLPPPPLIAGDRFISDYFYVAEDAEKLRVITDAMLRDETADLTEAERAYLESAIDMRPRIEELAQVTVARRGAEREEDEAAYRQLIARENELREEIAAWFSQSPAQVLIVVPEGFREHVESMNAQLAARTGEALPDDGPRPVILQNGADEKSTIAYHRVREAVRNWEQKVLQRRLTEANLPQRLHTPVDATDVDLAKEDQIAANVWSKIFPALLVIMAVTGAFYPAIDLGAGEKERGTMETLLICPATRTEIVTGKFFTVMLFSLCTALLNLISMGFTGRHMMSVAGGGKLSQFGDVAFPPFTSLAWVLLLAIPLAALFSALSLALAMFARSSKEGQYYLTPLLMVTMGLTMFCLNPAVEITAFYSIIPVVGPALLLKGLLLAQANTALLSLYAVPVLVTSVAYSMLALWWAIDLFQREDILFREAERFELGLWIRHLMRDKEPTPSFTEAAFCFVIIMLLQFASFGVMRDALVAEPTSSRALTLQMMYLLATVASPAMLMAIMLTTDVRATLKLRWPSGRMWGAAIVLALTLQPLAIELLAHLRWFFPQLPPGAARMLEAMSDEDLPLWLPMLAFAVTPAICEELAFRGFILSGLQRSGRTWLPIIMSSIAFGVVHMIPQQVFNAMLLGIVLGLLAIRSGSLWPGVLFHFIFNGLQVAQARIPPELFDSAPLTWLFSVERMGEAMVIRYDWPTLVVAGVVSLVMLRWLVRYRGDEPVLIEGATGETPAPTGEQTQEPVQVV
ncbi:ABC-2 family transporter protein [Maioricimonas rarisocia]|uniref:ABC-2 family transporter protein n=1 Tax=Maioricimonas rarisocia TaxID=2528026 RepID=A0A517ZDX4_9PLAN|nr:ABC transporter permease subunit/CPBP intramembrane protease [Maioricimonas rarisocia]QDU40640.1 ABC-2 family transporter protein [Maioricimonas rarisocia]